MPLKDIYTLITHFNVINMSQNLRLEFEEVHVKKFLQLLDDYRSNKLDETVFLVAISTDEKVRKVLHQATDDLKKTSFRCGNNVERRLILEKVLRVCEVCENNYDESEQKSFDCDKCSCKERDRFTLFDWHTATECPNCTLFSI